MKEPLVSIILPTRNPGLFIKDCLESIKKQSYKNIELIVIDRDSKDNTKEIAKKYTRKIFNKGPERGAQRNYGVKVSTGKYVLVLDQDMKLSEKVVEECVEKVIKDKNVKAIVIPEESFGEGFWSQCKKLERSFYIGVDWIEGARFFSREVYDETKGYNEDYIGGEDFDLPQRIEAKYGKKSIGRINALIFHNEFRQDIVKMCKKKFFYTLKLAMYEAEESNRPNFDKQTNLFSRYKLYFSDPKKLFKNPAVGTGMILMKTAEFISGGLGYVKGSGPKAILSVLRTNIITPLIGTKSAQINSHNPDSDPVTRSLPAETNNEKYYEENERYSKYLDCQDETVFYKYKDIVEKYLKTFTSSDGTVTAGKNRKFLDVGCGTGILMKMISKSKYDVYGIEVSKTSVDICKRKRLKCTHYNGTTIPFKSNYFDIVGSVNVLEHTNNPVEYLNENLRVLKTGGYLIIITPNFLSVTNSFHKNTTGLYQKSKNLINTIQLLLSPDVGFSKMEPINREDFMPDDDAVNVTNPISIIRWAKRNKLKKVYWSSQWSYKAGLTNYIDFGIFKFFLGSVFMVFQKKI